jgi:large subunit ribosomal protein L17
MHRHGYKGRKFGRERDQRRALLKGLMRSLIEHQAIVTTVPKAKELRPKMEKVISKARRGDLANRRRVIALVGDIPMGQLLVDKIAPQIKRSSGYLRIVKLDQNRVGDNAPMARVEFVDEISLEEVIASEAKQSSDKPLANEPTTTGSPRRTSSARDDSTDDTTKEKK